MATNVFDLVGKISIDTSGFMSALSIAQKGISVTAKAIGGFAGSAIQTGMEFDKSMSQVAATMGESMSQMEKEVGTVDLAWGEFSGNLRDYALEMGRETAFSATEAADALNYMALAGYDTQTSMEMLPNVLNLASAGTMELARASDMVTDTATAFGLTLENGQVDIARTTQMVDEMAKAASTGNTSVEQLGDAFLVVGGLAQELNGGMVTLSNGTTASVGGIQELEIALTGMASASIKGSEAGTHMRNMLLKLSSPSAEGAKQLEAMGVSAFNAEGKMRSLSDIFGDLSVSLGKLTQQEKIQAISDLFNARDIASAEALLAAVNQDWDKIGESILNADGAAQKMAETQLDNLAGAITIFKSAFSNMQIAFSDAISPFFKEFVKIGTSSLTQLTTAFKSGNIKEVSAAVKGFVKNVTKEIIKNIPQFVELSVELITAISTGLIENLPILIEAAGQIVGSLLNALQDQFPVLEPFFDTIKSAFSLIAEVGESAGAALKSIWDLFLSKIVGVTWTVFSGFLTGLADVLDRVSKNKTAVATLTTIVTVITSLVAAIKAYNTVMGIVKVVQAAVTASAGVLNAVWLANPIGLIVVALGAVIAVIVEVITYWDYLVLIWEESGKQWKKWLGDIAIWFSDTFLGIVDSWNWFWGQWTHGLETMWNGVLNSWNWFWGQWKHGIDTMWNVVVDTFGKIGDFFKGMWDGISWIFTTVGTKVGDAIGGAFKTAINAVIWTVEGALNAIPNAINSMINTINQLPNVNISAIPTVSLPRLAQGGVLKRGQVGYLEGDGDEAVVPLSKNTEWIDRVADKIGEKSGNSATYIFNFNIDNVNGSRDDMEENAELLMQIFTEKMARQGVVFA